MTGRGVALYAALGGAIGAAVMLLTGQDWPSVLAGAGLGMVVNAMIAWTWRLPELPE